jgi:hypothetical protein
LHEASFLKLDVTKATTLLNWAPRQSAAEAIGQAARWYRRRHDAGVHFDARGQCVDEIRAYAVRARGDT